MSNGAGGGGPSDRALPVVRGTRLITAFPLASGHGRTARSLFDLGVFERMVLFKIRRRDSEEGYDTVVRPRIPVSYVSAFLSLYLPGAWSRAVQRAEWVHFASPHFFHLSKSTRHASGTVHDIFFLDPSTHNWRDTPPGTRHFFPRVLSYVERLEGVMVVSRTSEHSLLRRHPDARTTVIHHWTGKEFRPRDRKEARERLQLPFDKTILLQVSIDNQRKNIEILPRILDRLDHRHVLVRIGDSSRIRGQFAPGRLIERTSVPPVDYPAYFNAADVLLAPSLDEGFGVPVIEGINSGIPVVASDIPVFREILKEHYPFFSPPRDPDRWVETLRAALERSRTDPRGEGLYSSIGDYYRAGRAMKEVRKFYHSLGVELEGVAPPRYVPGSTDA